MHCSLWSLVELGLGKLGFFASCVNSRGNVLDVFGGRFTRSAQRRSMGICVALSLIPTWNPLSRSWHCVESLVLANLVLFICLCSIVSWLFSLGLIWLCLHFATGRFSRQDWVTSLQQPRTTRHWPALPFAVRPPLERAVSMLTQRDALMGRVSAFGWYSTEFLGGVARHSAVERRVGVRNAPHRQRRQWSPDALTWRFRNHCGSCVTAVLLGCESTEWSVRRWNSVEFWQHQDLRLSHLYFFHWLSLLHLPLERVLSRLGTNFQFHDPHGWGVQPTAEEASGALQARQSWQSRRGSSIGERAWSTSVIHSCAMFDEAVGSALFGKAPGTLAIRLRALLSFKKEVSGAFCRRCAHVRLGENLLDPSSRYEGSADDGSDLPRGASFLAWVLRDCRGSLYLQWQRAEGYSSADSVQKNDAKTKSSTSSLIPVVLGGICPLNLSRRVMSIWLGPSFSLHIRPSFVSMTSPVCCMNPVIEGEGACAYMECGVLQHRTAQPVPEVHLAVVATINDVSGYAGAQRLVTILIKMFTDVLTCSGFFRFHKTVMFVIYCGTNSFELIETVVEKNLQRCILLWLRISCCPLAQVFVWTLGYVLRRQPTVILQMPFQTRRESQTWKRENAFWELIAAVTIVLQLFSHTKSFRN